MIRVSYFRIRLIEHWGLNRFEPPRNSEPSRVDIITTECIFDLSNHNQLRGYQGAQEDRARSRSLWSMSASWGVSTVPKPRVSSRSLRFLVNFELMTSNKTSKSIFSVSWQPFESYSLFHSEETKHKSRVMPATTSNVIDHQVLSGMLLSEFRRDKLFSNPIYISRNMNLSLFDRLTHFCERFEKWLTNSVHVHPGAQPAAKSSLSPPSLVVPCWGAVRYVPGVFSDSENVSSQFLSCSQNPFNIPSIFHHWYQRLVSRDNHSWSILSHSLGSFERSLLSVLPRLDFLLPIWNRKAVGQGRNAHNPLNSISDWRWKMARQFDRVHIISLGSFVTNIQFYERSGMVGPSKDADKDMKALGSIQNGLKIDLQWETI